jgi:large subunit ribosomal protein L17
MPVHKPSFRHLGRDSQHRQALLRNILDKLFEFEQVHTTFAKAKAVQRVADKIITLGKRGDAESRSKAQGWLFRPQLLPKIFNEFALRYKDRQGGYTRVLRTEPKKEDQAPSAILEMVDSPNDMKFMLLARTLAHRRANGLAMNEITALNVRKVLANRANGVEELRELVGRFEDMELRGRRLVDEDNYTEVNEKVVVEGEKDRTEKRRVLKKGSIGNEDDVKMPKRQKVYPDPMLRHPKERRWMETFKRMQKDPYR